MVKNDKHREICTEEWENHGPELLKHEIVRESEGYRVTGGEEILPHSRNYTRTENVIKKFITKVRNTHPLKLLWIFVLIILVTSGNAMQIIGLNFWLRQFPADGTPGNFTTLAVSGLLFSIFFLVMLAVYTVVWRPSLRFAFSLRGCWLLFLIGLMDMVNSAMAIYAASSTPEVLQALFTSLVPVYAAGFTKWLLKDRRNYFNVWIIVSFFCIISGVVTASAYQFSHSFDNDKKDTAWWCLIFFLSVPPTVLMNIWQSMYMIEFTFDPAFDDTFILSHLTAGTPEISAHTPENGINSRESTSGVGTSETGGIFNDRLLSSTGGWRRRIPPYQGEDTAVKLIMLSFETTIQFLLIMAILPMDALPWWGGSATVADAWANFSEGINCIFHCHNNFIFCIVYTAGFVFTYVGSAYLNQHSVTLCSMIGQLSSPFTALLLIIIPSWNVEKGYTPWYLSVLAIVLLSVGSLIYAVWEEKTEDEKEESERELKRELLSRLMERQD